MTSNSILLIEPFLPFPSKSGGHVAIYHGLKAIYDRFEKVYIVFPTKPYQGLQEEMDTLNATFPNLVLLPFLDDRYKGTPVERCKKEIKRFFAEKCKKQTARFFESITNSRPHLATELYSIKDYPNDFQQFICDTITDHDIPVVQIEFYWQLPLVACLPAHVTKIFVHHELWFVRQQLNLDIWGHNAYRESGVKISQWIEMAMLNQYDAVITLSEVDREKLIQSGVNVPIYASMAVVEDEPQRSPQPSTTTISFLGPYHHYPNWDGVMWFLENCWEKLLRQNPNFRFKIIGNWKKSKIKQITRRYPQVVFTGVVDNLDEALAGTTMIVPIRLGSGIRMKILEAAQLCVPFVTTTVGVEGLPFTNGDDCFVTDHPDTFVESILQLENQAVRQRLTEAAKKKVDAGFSFRTFKNNRMEIINRIVG